MSPEDEDSTVPNRHATEEKMVTVVSAEELNTAIMNEALEIGEDLEENPDVKANRSYTLTHFKKNVQNDLVAKKVIRHRKQGVPTPAVLALAVVYIQDAVHFWDCNHREDIGGLQYYSFMRSWLYRKLYGFLVWASFLLIVLETSLPFDQARYLPAGEIAILLLLGGNLVIRYKAIGPRVLKDPWLIFNAIQIAYSIPECIVCLALPYPFFRLAPIFRVTFLIALTDDYIREFRNIIQTFGYMGLCFVLLVLVVAVQTVVSMILFRVPGSTCQSPRGVPYFGNIFDAVFDQFILITTANFPDISFCGVGVIGWWANIYFFICMIIALYLVLNLTIAYVYSYFRAIALSGAKKKLQSRKLALNAAYEALRANGEGISQQTWSAVVEIIFPKEKQLAEFYFGVLNQNGDDVLDQEEFEQLLYTIVIRKISPVFPPASETAAKVMKWFEHPVAQYLRAAVLVLNAFSLVYDFTLSTDSGDLFHPIWLFVVDILFMVFFLWELSLSIFVYQPWAKYWSSSWRKAEFIFTTASILGKIILEFILQTLIPSIAIIRAAYIFRLLRILQIFVTVHALRPVVSNSFSLIIAMGPMWVSAFAVFWFFSLIGYSAFGGKMAEDNPLLVGSPYIKYEYSAYINFDSVAMSFYLMFHLLVVSGWFITADAAVRVTNKFALLFFVIFYFLGVLTILNLIISFFLETLRAKLGAHNDKDLVQILDIPDGRKIKLVSSYGDVELDLFRGEVEELRKPTLAANASIQSNNNNPARGVISNNNGRTSSNSVDVSLGPSSSQSLPTSNTLTGAAIAVVTATSIIAANNNNNSSNRRESTGNLDDSPVSPSRQVSSEPANNE